MIPKPAEESEDRRTVSLEFALEKYWGKNGILEMKRKAQLAESAAIESAREAANAPEPEPEPEPEAIPAGPLGETLPLFT